MKAQSRYDIAFHGILVLELFKSEMCQQDKNTNENKYCNILLNEKHFFSIQCISILQCGKSEM